MGPLRVGGVKSAAREQQGLGSGGGEGLVLCCRKSLTHLQEKEAKKDEKNLYT